MILVENETFKFNEKTNTSQMRAIASFILIFSVKSNVVQTDYSIYSNKTEAITIFYEFHLLHEFISSIHSNEHRFSLMELPDDNNNMELSTHKFTSISIYSIQFCMANYRTAILWLDWRRYCDR